MMPRQSSFDHERIGNDQTYQKPLPTQCHTRNNGRLRRINSSDRRGRRDERSSNDTGRYAGFALSPEKKSVNPHQFPLQGASVVWVCDGQRGIHPVDYLSLFGQ
jgi:hypothetical protein